MWLSFKVSWMTSALQGERDGMIYRPVSHSRDQVDKIEKKKKRDEGPDLRKMRKEIT